MSLLTGGTITGPSRGISSLTNRSLPSLTSLSHRSASLVAFAKKEGGVSSRTRRSDNRGKKGLVTTTEEEKGPNPQQNEELEILWEISKEPMPELPGQEPDFWEGPQWNAFGFVVQYLWAFGIVFALVACGIAVATYNQGATDFRETPAYKESMQSKELLDDSNSSSSEVFEQNPTEVAPPLE
ncbi:AT-rich interactive domain protein [Rhynchospora pubera]|uniref:AT-rich interactive domain protein n=1 Tax=Rhynchospora pubera TaxID=906938 RepID=A0AAV8D8U7_9POAL|nr:AT-rich interactive domain protein [Rhynchospora pubera]